MLKYYDVVEVISTPRGALVYLDAHGKQVQLNQHFNYLKNDVGFKPDPNCIDGCIYYKNSNIGEEYCFAPVANEEDSALLFCQVRYTICTNILIKLKLKYFM